MIFSRVDAKGSKRKKIEVCFIHEITYNVFKRAVPNGLEDGLKESF